MSALDPSSSSSLDPDRTGPIVSERRVIDDRTAGTRLRDEAGAIARRSARVLGLSAGLTLLLIVASLTLDIPFTGFDGFMAAPSLLPSQWVASGDIFLLICFFVMLLMTRRFGASTVSRAQALSWLVFIALAVGMLVYLAPSLEEGDLVDGRYVTGLMVSWYVASQIAIRLYDVVRGGRWWRPPLMASLIGLCVGAVLFFPIAYGGTQAPWGLWMVVDISYKAVATIGFLGVYYILRARITPRRGLGGR